MIPRFEFDELEFLTVGTHGPKGQREFFLQARAEGRLVSLKLEKQQVSALADYLDRVLEELPGATPAGETPDPTDLSLREPVVPAFTVASMGIAYIDDLDRLVLLAEGFPPEDDESVADADPSDDDPDVPQARFALRREQVAGLIERARELVAAGRPPCPFCGRPLEPRNHDWCPCHN